MKKLLLILFIFQANFFIAQEVAVGSWRDYLSYSDVVSVTEANEMLYCATSSALFTYNKSDFSIERLNLVNGLSDIGLSQVKYNDFNNIIIITYTNGNIDIIDKDKNITNLPSIKTANTLGSKNIKHIYFQEHLAYLSTGFGIVVLNTEKIEIVETYLFGPLGADIVTNAVTIDDSYIYAATDQGIFFANKNSANLIDFNAWSLLPELGAQSYSGVVSFSNRLFASLDSPNDKSDTLYYNDGGLWQKFIGDSLNIEQLIVSNNILSVIQTSGYSLFGLDLVNISTILSDSEFFISPNGIHVDAEGLVWLADNFSGLIRINKNLEKQFIVPNSPSSTNTFQMSFLDNHLWVASGGYGQGINSNIFNHKKPDGSWEDFRLFNFFSNERIEDIVAIAIDPQNSDHVYLGSFDNGLIELNNGIISNVYNAENSVLDSTFFGSTASSDLVFDSDDNLWVLNSFTTDILTVKTSSGDWYNYSFPGKNSNQDVFTRLLIDDNDYKWILAPDRDHIIIFNDNKTLEDTSDDISVVNDNIPGARIYDLCKDKDGEIWVGTDEGVAVFYNPSNVFEENIEAEQIFIEQDGQTQILLESEIITAITIDGANRKWIGTQTSGVYLMSEDGTLEIEHFTQENSPLFSNNIFDIVIDPETGEVYIGTEKGLISYKGTATEGDANYDNVYVYPNPVKPDFTGTIAIRGLVKDTDVRITDISGNIVFQTTSFGGQAVWDGKDLNGNEVQTGVYMIFNGSANGDQKAAAKVLIYH